MGLMGDPFDTDDIDYAVGAFVCWGVMFALFSDFSWNYYSTNWYETHGVLGFFRPLTHSDNGILFGNYMKRMGLKSMHLIGETGKALERGVDTLTEVVETAGKGAELAGSAAKVTGGALEGTNNAIRGVLSLPCRFAELVYGTGQADASCY